MAALAAAVALAVAATPAARAQCAMDYPDVGTTYDLGGLETAGLGYQVMDSKHDVESNNFTYVFNICGNLARPPPSHTDDGSYGNNCNATYGHDGSEMYGPSPAYQVSNVNGFCYRLADNIHAAESTEWSLVNADNPSRGVVLTYKNGNQCEAGFGRRAFSIYFFCGPDARNPFSVEGHLVEEKDHCEYEVITESTFGCPQQCPVVGGRLCSGAGVCDYDTDAKKSKCFCQPGYTSNDCSEQVVKPSGGLGATGGVLIFICILLVALLGVLVYLWNRIRTLRLDPKAYSQLRGGGPGDDEGTEDI